MSQEISCFKYNIEQAYNTQMSKKRKELARHVFRSEHIHQHKPVRLFSINGVNSFDTNGLVFQRPIPVTVALKRDSCPKYLNIQFLKVKGLNLKDIHKHLILYGVCVKIHLIFLLYLLAFIFTGLKWWWWDFCLEFSSLQLGFLWSVKRDFFYISGKQE